MKPLTLPPGLRQDLNLALALRRQGSSVNALELINGIVREVCGQWRSHDAAEILARLDDKTTVDDAERLLLAMVEPRTPATESECRQALERIRRALRMSPDATPDMISSRAVAIARQADFRAIALGVKGGRNG